MKMQEQLMRYTAIFSTLFSVTAMAVMLYFASVKTIVIAEDVTAGRALGEHTVQITRQSLKLSENSTDTGALRIPVSDKIRPDNIVIENRYIDHVFNIFITGSEIGFYQETEINGNMNSLLSATYQEEKDVTKLQLQMDGVYEHKYLFENNILYLEFFYPKDLYDKIVVIDAAHGGEDYGNHIKGIVEKEMVLDIAMRLREKLEQESIRAYFTRTEDSNPSKSDRAALANQSGADFFISIHVNADGNDPTKYGTEVRYNPNYVIPYFGNVELSDLLEREVVKQIDGRANGLFEIGEEEVLLSQLTMPAAQIEIGYMTHEKEASLLKYEEYREGIAQGMYTAIMKAYEAE